MGNTLERPLIIDGGETPRRLPGAQPESKAKPIKLIFRGHDPYAAHKEFIRLPDI